MTNEIEKIETPFDCVFSALAALKRLYRLFKSVSVRPATEWFENNDVREASRISISAAVEEANCISEEIKAVIDKLQNTEIGLTTSVLNENEEDSVREELMHISVREALLHISADVEYIKNELINRQTLIHEIDAYYDAETE